MNKYTGIIVLSAALTGCVASPEPLPYAAAKVSLVPVSSANVTVRNPVLQMNAGSLLLVGFVVKVYEAETTENTHLDVVFLDGGRRMLGDRTTSFSPQRLITARRAPNRQGHYSVALEDLPPGTASIEVRAHDGPHQPADVKLTNARSDG